VLCQVYATVVAVLVSSKLAYCYSHGHWSLSLIWLSYHLDFCFGNFSLYCLQNSKTETLFQLK